MKEDYLISITGTMEMEGDNDTVELLTKGSFVQRNNHFFIRYAETQATGYDGNTTTVKVENNHKISMIRRGSMPSELVVEKGKRHVCHYDTPQGSLSLGVAADEITTQLTEHGGEVTFSYVLDTGNMTISRNKVHIKVRKGVV